MVPFPRFLLPCRASYGFCTYPSGQQANKFFWFWRIPFRRRIYAPTPSGYPLQSDAIFSKLKPVVPKFSNLPARTEKQLSCAIYIYSAGNNPDEEHRTPPIHLDREHVAILNQLRAGFDLIVDVG